MMIRIFNAKILTKDNGIIDGEMWIDDGKITFLSTVSPLIALPWDREIDANGNLVIPSFKNGHGHSPMTFLRSYADDLPLHSWLFDKIFPNEAKLQEDDVYWLTKLAIAEYLSSGISAVCDMYFHLPAIVQASVECGFRNVIIEGITQGNGPKDKLFERLQYGIDNYAGKGDGLITYQLGLHAEYTNEMDNMLAMQEFASEKKMPVFMHLAETEKEVLDCKAKYGKSPVELFSDMGMFEYGGCGYHCCHLSAHDIELLSKNNVSVVSCPASNLKLVDGIAPLVELQKAGVNIGLGTDGPASNNCLDMLKEMFLATALQKYVQNDASAMDAYSVFDMATCGSAKAMRLEGLEGLAVGQKADITIIDLHTPNMQPINNLIKNLVYAGSKANVLMTIVDGVIRYERGNFYIGEDMERIYAKCQAIADRIKE